MKIKNDKSLILNTIKSHYGFKNDYEFANFLEINPATLANWHTRNTFNLERIYSKCKDIDANWLITGDGNMLRPKKKKVITYRDPDNPFGTITEEIDEEDENDKESEDKESYKDKYILLLERYSALLEDKLNEYMQQIAK